MDIAAAVEQRLSPTRVRECNKATRLLMAACGYVMARGTLTYCGCKVVKMVTIVANVEPGDFDGGADRRGHWWLHFHYERDGGHAKADLDLTARQFYHQLADCFMGNPRLAPLSAKTEKPPGDEGIEVEGMEEWENCGAKEDPIEAYANKPDILEALQTVRTDAEQHLDTAMRLVFRKLNL